jgi:1-phosphofructokinase family hexose kinase
MSGSILVAGLSPAWQQILSFDALELGEVNRARSAHWCGSGKVLNVGIALASLQVPAQTLTVLGGSTGREIEREFQERQIPLDAVPTHSVTRVCTTLLDQSQQVTTELVENALPITEDELDAFCARFRHHARDARLIVITGSLAPGAPHHLWADLLANVSAPVLLDIRGPELSAALPLRPLLVKPNREELGHTLGRKLETDDDLDQGIAECLDRGAQWVLISDGPRPARLVSATHCYRLTPARVETVNPIGCGDCLTAGTAAQILQRTPVPDAVRYGMACAAENARQLLPAQLFAEQVSLRLNDTTCTQVS